MEQKPVNKMNAVFSDRRDAGQKLAQQLLAYTNSSQAIVLGLPRGGVPVAYEIAKSLNIPLDVCLVRKLGLPGYPETAMGAVAEDALLNNYSGSITIIDQDTAQNSGLSPERIQAIAAKEKAELRWRESCYRHSRPMLTIDHRTIIVVDDGLATGLTMHAAVEVLRQHQPAEIIIATPVASRQAIAKLKHQVNQIICLVTPKSLGAVGFWYENFTQTTDQEVCNLLVQQTCQNLTESC
jgi:predicted phosphoribosyltransferase